MKIINDTLKPWIGKWDDPGEPGVLGGCLPSYQYVAEVTGEIVLELEGADFLLDGDGVGVETDLPHAIKVTKWHVAIRDGKVVLTVAEFDAEFVEQPEEGE
jgi:hypothetical protein